MAKPMNFMFDGHHPGDSSTPENLPQYDCVPDYQQDQEFEDGIRQDEQFEKTIQPDKQGNPHPFHRRNVAAHENTYDERRETMLKYTFRFILITMFVGAFYYFGIRRINQNYEQAIAMENGAHADETPVIEPEPADDGIQKGLVTAISYSETNPVAVIDNEVLKVGESIHGVTVVSIMPDKVEFQKNGKTWIQEVRQDPPSDW